MYLLHTHTKCCLGQDLFTNIVGDNASWPCSLTICVKVLFFSYYLFISWQIYFILTHNVALVENFTLVCTLWPSNGRVCIVLRNIHLCWKVIKYKSPAFMRDPHFPLVPVMLTNESHNCICSLGLASQACKLSVCDLLLLYNRWSVWRKRMCHNWRQSWRGTRKKLRNWKTR